MKSNIKTLFLLALLIKLLIALFIPLTLDEYYYLVWGQNPQLSYFDHPPMVGWLMYFGDFFKSLSPGAIRWPFIVLSHGTVFVWYLILREHLKPQHLFYFLLVALLNPLWGCGVFIATPDIPLLFFWSTSILASLRLYEKPSTINYMTLGASLGLGFLAKYQIVLFLPCLVLFIHHKKAYKHLLTTKVFLAVVAGLIFSLPVILWNYQNEWASFTFQWNHGMQSTDWKWFWPLEYLFGQFFILFPLFAILAFKNAKSSHPLSTLHSFAIFPLLFFLYSSFKGHVEANWAIMVHPSLYALAFIQLEDKHLVWIKRTLCFWFAIVVLVLSLVFFSQNEKVKKLRLFESSKFNNVLEFAKQNPSTLPFSYQMSSFLSFHLERIICKFPKYGRIDYFNFRQECLTLPNHFYFVLPHGYIPPVENDFPEYKVVNNIKIDDQYFALEVLKR